MGHITNAGQLTLCVIQGEAKNPGFDDAKILACAMVGVRWQASRKIRGPSATLGMTQGAKLRSGRHQDKKQMGRARKQNLESRAKRALYKVPHLQSSPDGRGEEAERQEII